MTLPRKAYPLLGVSIQARSSEVTKTTARHTPEFKQGAVRLVEGGQVIAAAAAAAAGRAGDLPDRQLTVAGSDHAALGQARGLPARLPTRRRLSTNRTGAPPSIGSRSVNFYSKRRGIAISRQSTSSALAQECRSFDSSPRPEP